MNKLQVATMDVGFLNQVTYEVVKARNNFPGNSVMTIALVEQVGKLAQALEHTRRGGGDRCGAIHVWEMAVTVAAMAMRVATEGDSSVPAYSPETGFDSTQVWQF
jgi:hypothetical protein